MNKQSRTCTRSSAIAAALLLTALVGTLFTGCTGSVAISPAAGQAQVSDGSRAPQRTLIVIDLSPSLTTKERLRTPQLVAGVIREQPPGSTITVFLLETNMGNREPLLDVSVPDAATTGEVIDGVIWLQRVQRHLQESVEEILKWPMPKQRSVLTSCYLASADFANGYFAKKPVATNRRLIWIGDLIEDCPKNQFARYRLANADAIKGLQWLQLDHPSLKGVEIQAVMIPRSLDDPESEVPAETIRSYWGELPRHLGLAAGGISVGTSDDLGIVEMPPQ